MRIDPGKLSLLALGLAIAVAIFVYARHSIPMAAPGVTEHQAESMLAELREIRALLEDRQGAEQPGHGSGTSRSSEMALPLRGRYMLGAVDAPITMVEFTDYECPFCRKFHATTFPQLKREYIETGKIRYIHWDMPLEIHNHAVDAALAARCASEQGRFWEMRHSLMISDSLAKESIVRAARALRLNPARFEDCLEAGAHVKDIRDDLSRARRLGVTGTPTFILGETTAAGVQGTKIVGAQSLPVFEEKIRQLLSTQ